jgi:hypothetical protein
VYARLLQDAADRQVVPIDLEIIRKPLAGDNGDSKRKRVIRDWHREQVAEICAADNTRTQKSQVRFWLLPNRAESSTIAKRFWGDGGRNRVGDFPEYFGCDLAH